MLTRKKTKSCMHLFNSLYIYRSLLFTRRSLLTTLRSLLFAYISLLFTCSLEVEPSPVCTDRILKFQIHILCISGFARLPARNPKLYVSFAKLYVSFAEYSLFYSAYTTFVRLPARNRIYIILYNFF